MALVHVTSRALVEALVRSCMSLVEEMIEVSLATAELDPRLRNEGFHAMLPETVYVATKELSRRDRLCRDYPIHFAAQSTGISRDQARHVLTALLQATDKHL